MIEISKIFTDVEKKTAKNGATYFDLRPIEKNLIKAFFGPKYSVYIKVFKTNEISVFREKIVTNKYKLSAATKDVAMNLAENLYDLYFFINMNTSDRDMPKLVSGFLSKDEFMKKMSATFDRDGYVIMIDISSYLINHYTSTYTSFTH